MGKIEPLQTLLKVYKDKHNCLMKYLPEKTIHQLTNTYFLDEDNETLYLDDMIFFVDKSTGLIEKRGKVIKITDDKIVLRIQNKYNVTFLKEDYYLFKKVRKRKNKKDFYESLLNSLR